MPTARRTTKATAPVEVDDEFEDMEEMEETETDEADIEESDEDDEDLEELEELEEVEEEEAPAKPTRSKATKAKAEKSTATAKAPTIEFGSPWLAQHINEVVPGQKYDARSVRMLLRKLAKDGKLNREVGVERARYNFSGPEDAIVKAVVAMVKSGEAKELKQAGLQAVKDKAAAKAAAKEAAQAAAAAEDVEVEEAPKPARRTRAAAAKPAAPAKATPAKAAPAKATTARRSTAAAN